MQHGDKYVLAQKSKGTCLWDPSYDQTVCFKQCDYRLGLIFTGVRRCQELCQEYNLSKSGGGGAGGGGAAGVWDGASRFTGALGRIWGEAGRPEEGLVGLGLFSRMWNSLGREIKIAWWGWWE